MKKRISETMKKKKIILVIICLLFLSGCTATYEINIKDDSAAEKKIYIAYECPEILLSIAQEDKAVVEKSYFEFKIGGFRAKGNKQSSVLTFFRIYYEEMELRDVTTIKEI